MGAGCRFNKVPWRTWPNSPSEGEEAKPAGKGLPRAWAEPVGTPGREDAGNSSSGPRSPRGQLGVCIGVRIVVKNQINRSPGKRPGN